LFGDDTVDSTTTTNRVTFTALGEAVVKEKTYFYGKKPAKLSILLAARNRPLKIRSYF
jgi:hypothetical protein